MTLPRARSNRGRNLGQSAEAIHLPKAGGDRRTANDEAREILAEIGVNPVKMLAEIAKSGTASEAVRARALEQLLPYVMPREKQVSQEMEELRARLETVQRFVILGEVEDASGEEWERRNAHWREWLAKRELSTPREPVAVVTGPIQ